MAAVLPVKLSAKYQVLMGSKTLSVKFLPLEAKKSTPKYLPMEPKLAKVLCDVFCGTNVDAEDHVFTGANVGAV